ncbi:hypothetical protein ATANTOWER_005893 [Ataeniobius toweri]|uniref:Uncharacterized protein n=1 Tax=Ataeniobius toweri TaxID=208326 RepID=A0ABU7BC21_9TELE|nr:hypothetical protein [Ataeniobius toweri]
MQTVPRPCLTAQCSPLPQQPCSYFTQRWRRLQSPWSSGCIFSLVVVFVPHGSGTFFAAARHEIPISSAAEAQWE